MRASSTAVTPIACPSLAAPVADEPLTIEFEFDGVYKLHEMRVWNYNVMFELMLGFGLRRLSHLLLPRAALDLGKHSLSQLHFLPDEIVQMGDRWHEIADQPVSNFLEKKKKLLFCTPETAFPELLALLDESKDSSLPVIVVEGDTQKLVGMVSTWDVLEGIIMGRLIKGADGDDSSADDE